MAEKQPRKRVSQACVPCGIKRIKCDAALPSCGQCIKRGDSECTYGISKRNKRQKITVPPAFLQPAPSPLKDESKASHRRDDQQSGPLLPIPNAAVVTPTVSARLFKNYFTIVHPMWPILYKPVYDLVDYENLAETLPTPLLYAIYAIAACVQLQPDHNNQKPSDTENLPPLPSPEVLFETALSALQRFDRGESGYHPLNVLKPTIETCQALTILALQQHGVAEAASAALLCGMASAMAIEMHLHKAMSPDSDPTQVQVSSRLWWNIFVLDKMMACEMGRPVVLRSEETNTPFPSVTESDEYQLLPVKSTGTHRATSIKTQTLSGFHTSIRISVIMEMVSRQIYSMSAREAIRNNPKSGEETRQRLWRELHEYHQMLDASSLRLDMKNSTIAAPVTITNMVWMWCTVILSNRPFVTYSEAPRISQVHETHASSDPLEVCVMAANNTCLILERYAENLAAMSCDLIFPIFTSASILAHYSKRIGSEGIETQRRIDLCIRWLLILGKSWKSAEDRKKVLTQNLGLRRNNEHQHSEEPRESYQSASSMKDSTIGTGYVEDIPLSLPTASNTLVPPQPPNPEQGFVEDWAFLRNLGNTTDDFYTIDAEFREFLDREYEVDDIYGLF